MRIIITRSKTGGVGYYFDKINPHFQNKISYVTVGKRTLYEPLVHMLIRQIGDYIRFSYNILFKSCDLIHLNPSFKKKAVIRDGILLLTAKLFRKKAIVFFHGWDEEFESTIKKKYFKLFKFFYFNADVIIVLASQFKTSLEEIGYNKPIYVETTLVPENIFKIQHVKSKIFNQKRLNILFLSRIEKYKGVYEAIDAYIILKKKYKYLTLTIAGEGSELDSLNDYIKSINISDIEMLGWVDENNKDETYRKADIYLFPTYGEGMPISVLEAMAYGLPVITCPVGGINDFFQNGEMGYLSENPEPENLAKLCESLINDREKIINISKYNQEYAANNFKASIVCKRLEAIYNDITKFS